MEPHICRCSGLYVCGWRHIWQNDYLYAINAKMYHRFMQEGLRVTILVMRNTGVKYLRALPTYIDCNYIVCC